MPSRWWANIRHPVRALRTVAGDGPAFALVVLFGLNAVDELDRTGFGILLPTIRDHFGMSDSGILSLVALTMLGALLLQLPIAIWADRGSRVRLAIWGGIAWGVFSFATGMASTVLVLVLIRSGAGIGRAVVDPTHSSLLSDYYPIERRPAVFSFHRSANAVGQFVGPLTAGVLSHFFGWRVPFFVFAIPTLIFVVLAFRMREPIRGAWERAAAGESAEAIETEEPQASFGEAWRTVWKIESLRRIWYAIPFLAVSIIGFVSLAGLLYDRAYGYNDLQRGLIAACVEPVQLLGLAIGGRVGVKLMMKDPALVFRFLKTVAFVSGGWAVMFAWSPNIVLTIIANIGLTSSLAILLPGMLSALSIAIPSRARAVGFSVASYWAIPGLIFVPAIGWISDNLGIRWGMLLLAPIMVIGGLMISTVSTSINRDIADVWAASAARSRALIERRNGNSKLLVVDNINVSYGTVQVLFDVSLEVDEGEVVALLGTNGAGKSTLLKAICGIAEADYGAIIFDGRDITHAPPHEIATFGVGQMPGGHGVFGPLSVAENLAAAAWLRRKDRAAADAAIAQALEAFPTLKNRLHDSAGNLSGGQQQMLALAMNLISAPRLLMIDELSLGLAPVIVEQLAALVKQVAAEGTTVILVEQSVNVALTLADRALFMEKGEIQFSGPTSDLLDRPDLLRSVFLGKAVAAATAREPRRTAARTPLAPPVLETRDLSVAFGGVRAVDQVSLQLDEREILGLIGPNGAGKTTLLDLICGYTASDGGLVMLGDWDVSAVAPHIRAQQGLGRSFQDAALFPTMTVHDTILTALERWVEVGDPLNALLRTPSLMESEHRLAARVDDLMDLFDLGPVRHRFIGELSTGSRRIVDLACVVAHSPAVLLLDEPSSGIAQRESEALGPLIMRLRDELGCAIVVIEHDMPLLASICDRMIALESGSVIATGTPDQVLSDERVISSYLGTSPEVINRSGVAPAPTVMSHGLPG
ncbi:MAG: MFS transporter [Actinobacteria bacterium]|nr:MFS transporter [Actinomycetota bacterium]